MAVNGITLASPDASIDSGSGFNLDGNALLTGGLGLANTIAGGYFASQTAKNAGKSVKKNSSTILILAGGGALLVVVVLALVLLRPRAK